MVMVMVTVNHDDDDCDVDSAAGLWPLGQGTVAPVQRIFPGLWKGSVRSGIRVVQQALGGWSRRLYFNEVSALLCFWKRSRDGTLGWGQAVAAATP